MKVNDLTGQQFGLLTVLERDIEAQKEHHSNRAYWKCQCKCGNIISRSSNALKTAKIPSCGCYNNQREAQIKDITGQKFGKLTVISRNTEIINKSHRDSYWNCICECGRSCIKRKSSLRNSKTISCDFCQRKKDLTNQRQYMLTILYPTGEMRNGCYTIWHCKCDCGNELDLDTNELSWKRSCGCMNRKSKGEMQIELLLQENNITYLFNKGYFSDLLLPSGYIGRYDFILFENDKPFRIIEFDGLQHFSKDNFFFTNGRQSFEERQKIDKIKNEYAKTHNIPLVRIPYTMLNHITIDTILGDNFLVI